jgi:hypothetical protein
MTIDIRVLENQEILMVTYSSDDVTAEDLSKQRSEVSDALTKNALNKVLIDALELKCLPPVWTTFHHNRSIPSDRNLHNAKFAVVFNSIGQDERFLETSGLNAGVKIRCFTSREEAMSWLSA